MVTRFQTILGINFFVGDFEGLLALCPQGKFIVVPSGPNLADMPHEPAYREAVENADFAITDSGYMVLLWFLCTGQKLPRISGLKFLRGLLEGDELRRPGASFWVMPTAAEMAVNLDWLNGHGYPVASDSCYIAPLYAAGPLQDAELLRRLEAARPAYVIVNLGGGVQERLGYFLKKNLSYRPTIICTGAAIAFVTGIQANIPHWADAWMLGWLMRCLRAPQKFVPRYLRAAALAGVVFRYRARSVAPDA
jgi:UDP-N-acetyl-D-mannosaminuronic acid transferase (WecB/TagA/CpsF family)